MNLKSVIVIGEKPEEQMELFNLNKQVEKYLVYQINDAKKIHQQAINTIKNLINTLSNEKKYQSYVNSLSYKLMEYENMTEIEYFHILTQDYIHDEDGNAWSVNNPQGKWLFYQNGKEFSIPLQLKDGSIAFQAKKKDIDWDKIHLFNTETYSNVWEITQNNKEPITEDEKKIKEVMSDYAPMVAEFLTKDIYVKYNTSYWNYAVVKNGVWEDMDDKDSKEWVINFWGKFIQPLDDDELITIFEYKTTENDRNIYNSK